MKTIEEIRAFYEACKKAQPLFGRKFEEYKAATSIAKGLGPCPACCPECSNEAMLRWIFPDLEKIDG